MALASGISNARDLARFRKERSDVCVEFREHHAPPKILPSDVVKSFAYGRKGRPSTPINGVVGYQFASEHQDALQDNYNRYEEERNRQIRALRIKTTKSQTLRAQVARKIAHAEVEEVKEPFKLTKFKKVGARFHLPDRDAEQASLQRSFSLPSIRSRSHVSRPAEPAEAVEDLS